MNENRRQRGRHTYCTYGENKTCIHTGSVCRFVLTLFIIKCTGLGCIPPLIGLPFLRSLLRSV